GYIHSGTMKYVVYSDDGAEHVVGLEFAGEFVADFPFSIHGDKARVTIIADSDCEIYRYPVATIAERLKTDDSLRDIIQRSTEVVFSQTYDRYVDLYCKTPAQRYHELIHRHPNLFNLFSLKDIASFLNISPTHLSRLRHMK
ncbi:MAG: Crp/Fnr family transcriptional regulator, partial [Muribaculum sp.]|nr:Crp/Fnr family transcriptional regulator [Muribaculum sp.]